MYSKEIELQMNFVNLLENEIQINESIITEFNARFGNVDIVKVNYKSEHKLSLEQAEVLSSYQCARTLAMLHKRAKRTIEYLQNNTGYTYSYLMKALANLKKYNIINEENKRYIISDTFEFPNVEFVAYEAKLNDWQKAISQALINQNFASYSYVVMPYKKAQFLTRKHREIFNLYNVGLIGVSNENYFTFIDVKKQKKDYASSPIFIRSVGKYILNEEATNL